MSLDNEVWIEPGDGSEKQLAIWRPDLSGTPKGALILVHSMGDQPLTSKTMRPLQDHLSLQGWASLSIGGPEVNKTSAPLKQTELQARAVSTLNAAMAFLHSKGQYNIALLGDGLGNAWVWSFAQQLTGMPETGPAKTQTLRSNTQSAEVSYDIRAIIMLNTHDAMLANPYLDEAFSQWPAKAPYPILDIYVENYGHSSPLAKKRRDQARQLGLTKYRQKRFPATPPLHLTEQNALFKYIRGFLDSQAEGIQLR